MLPFHKELEIDSYARFRCLGAECPDTCCEGWRVVVDKNSFDRYQQCSDPAFQPRFQELVTINASPTPGDYASITLDHGRCPFLSDKLCSIQTSLGEGYLSHTCATFPRNIRPVFGTTEKSLDISCPEAARLLLTDERPLSFGCGEADHSSLRDQADYPQQARTLVIGILQDRRSPLRQRLMLVAHLCDLLSRMPMPLKRDEARELVYAFGQQINSGDLAEHLAAESAASQPSQVTQLELVLHLINERIRLDFVSQRYLDLYREFAEGIQMRAGSRLDELTPRFSEARRRYYTPFIERHGYMLENYLVSYVFKTVFPFGWSAGDLSAECNFDPVQRFLVLAAYYAIMQTVMIGLAGKYKSEFGAEHVVRCVQSTSRALEHCISYAPKVLQILAAKGIGTATQMLSATG